MNGRVYDPALGRFLSVDPVYQAPTNMQSLNPYSYVLNNPLSLVDPTGYDAAPCGGSDKCTTDTGSHIAGVTTGVKGQDLSNMQAAQGGRFLAKVQEALNKAFGAAAPSILGLTKVDGQAALVLASNGEKNKDQGINSALTNSKDQGAGEAASNAGLADMHLSVAGQKELKDLEGHDDGQPVLTTKPDVGGNPTIGWGHKITAGDKDLGASISVDKAQELFDSDVSKAEAGVKGIIAVRLTQNQFDALVMVSFNVGHLGIAAPKLVRDVNSGNYTGAASEINFRYYHDQAGNKRYSPGLDRRSQAEQSYFINGPNN